MFICAKFPDLLRLRMCIDGKLQLLFVFYLSSGTFAEAVMEFKIFLAWFFSYLGFLGKVPIQFRSSNRILNLKVHKSGSPQENKLSSALQSFVGEKTDKYFIAYLKLKVSAKAAQPLCVGIKIIQDCCNLSEL